MKLIQKKFPFRVAEFEITDAALKISRQRLFGCVRYEVSYKNLRSDFMYVRNFPIWLLLGVIGCWGATGLALNAYLHPGNAPGADLYVRQNFLVLVILLSLTLGFATGLRFFQRKVDGYMVQNKVVGGITLNRPRRGAGNLLRQNIFIQRTVPNEAQVQEFLNTLKAKIADEEKALQARMMAMRTRTGTAAPGPNL